MARKIGFGSPERQTAPKPQRVTTPPRAQPHAAPAAPSKPAAQQDFDWSSALAPSERIIWQGRPDASFAFEDKNLRGILIGLFCLAICVPQLTGLDAENSPTFYPVGIFVIYGIFTIASPFFFGMYRRAHTRYALTNRRAFIGANMPIIGRRLKTYPIMPNTVLATNHKTLAKIYFASETRPRPRQSIFKGTYQEKIGFERIAGGDEIYALMHRIQQGQL